MSITTDALTPAFFISDVAVCRRLWNESDDNSRGPSRPGAASVRRCALRVAKPASASNSWNCRESVLTAPLFSTDANARGEVADADRHQPVTFRSEPANAARSELSSYGPSCDSQNGFRLDQDQDSAKLNGLNLRAFGRCRGRKRSSSAIRRLRF
jgi:hypothetical protein